MKYNKTLFESLRRNNLIIYKIARDFKANYNNVDIVYFYKDKNALYKF